jgi:uncharacterized protein YbjT (DUF2867 family)
MKTALVTGATGFLGTNLVEELVGQGWQVTALRPRVSDVGDLQRSARAGAQRCSVAR